LYSIGTLLFAIFFNPKSSNKKSGIILEQ
jgi:hypothetical protein